MRLPTFSLSAKYTPAWIIGMVTLLAHGWLLLNDGMHWDGLTQVYLPLANDDWARLYDLFDSYGYPIRAYQHWAAAQLGGIIWGHQVVTLLAIGLGAWFTYRVMWQSGAFSHRDSLLIALVSLLFPAYRVSTELIMMPYSVGYAAFMLGLWCLLQAEGRRGRGHWLWRGLALASLFFSFWIYSLLPFFYGMILLLAWRVLQPDQERPLYERLWRYGLAKLDFFLLPLLFWAMLQTLFPQPSYYQPGLPDNLGYGLLQYLRLGLAGQFAQALGIVIAFPVLGLGLAFAGLGLSHYWEQRQDSTTPLAPVLTLLWGFLLLGLAMFPYLMIGKFPTALDDGSTRHNLLLGLPVAAILVSSYRLLPAAQQPRALTLLCLLLPLFAALTVNNYLEWQGRWVKNRAIIQALESQPHYQTLSLFWIDDRFPFGPQPYYGPHEWSAFFNLAWGGESHLGLGYQYPLSQLASFAQDEQRRSHDYVRHADLAGCQAVLTIQRGPQPQSNRDTWGISLRYWAFKYLLPNRLENYLAQLVEVEIRPILAPQAQHCAPQTAYLEAHPQAAFGGEETWLEHLSLVNAILYLEGQHQRQNVPAAENDLYSDLLDQLLESPTPSPQEQADLQAGGFDVLFYQRYQALKPAGIDRQGE